MNRNFKILILEHDPTDIELLKRELTKAFPEHVSHVVQTEQGFEKALVDFAPDIILSDYSLPTFDGASAFIVKQLYIPDVPFILVSGTIGEENAVELIKSGVTDYVLKDKLYSLSPKIIRALNEAEEKVKKKTAEEALYKSEANMRTIFETTDVGFLLMDNSLQVVDFNNVAEQWAKNMFYSGLVKGTNLRSILLPERVFDFDRMIDAILRGEEVEDETNYPDSAGVLNWFWIHGKPVIDKENKIIGICLSVKNITLRKHAEEQIQKITVVLEDKVKERTSELVEANTALEAFSYSVSHDLRTPLRSVIGFSRIINKEYAHQLNPDMKELFGHIEVSSKRMSSIIDDLLVLARSAKEKLNLEEVDMNVLFKSVWDNLLYSSPHNAVLEMPQLPIVYADSSMLEQVIVNLLSNAVKYSSKKAEPTVKLGFEEAEEEIIFSVADNGAGFDMKNYDRLFGAFQRLHGIVEFEGTGVGLLLIKRIIEKHGGRVWGEGKVNEGATFYFSMPKKNIQDSLNKAEMNYII